MPKKPIKPPWESPARKPSSHKLFSKNMKIVGSISTAAATIFGVIVGVYTLSDDGRNPTLDSPIGMEESGLYSPVPCHIQGAFPHGSEVTEGKDATALQETERGLFGLATDSIRFTAEGESSYTVHNVSLVGVSEISDNSIEKFVDATLGGCGSAGGENIDANFDFDNPTEGREFVNHTSSGTPQRSKTFPSTTVTKENSLTVDANVNSCENSYEFSIEVEYSKAGESDSQTQIFGPYEIYSMDKSKPLYSTTSEDNSVSRGAWGESNLLCNDHPAF